MSIDGGKTWQDADDLIMEDKPSGKVWSWTLWRAQLDISNRRGDLDVMVRAYDSKGNRQDSKIENLYNLRGIMNNAPHSMKIQVNV